MTVHVIATGALSGAQLTAIRAMLDDAFDGEFSDDDWEHGLGGTHALVADGERVVAHASVVARLLWIGDEPVRTGYVEAVAVATDRQRRGLGAAVMRAIGDEIRATFDLGALSTGAWAFYERAGWERWHGPTWVRHADGRIERTADEDGGIMILRTPATPDIDPGARIACTARHGDDW